MLQNFPGQVGAAKDLDQTKNVFLEHFGDAVSTGALDDFRAACATLLLAPPTPYCVPYAFAYEARSLLHDPRLWVPPENGRAYRPTSGLLAALDRCLERPEAIDCRDNYYWPIIAGLRHFIVGDVEPGFRALADAARLPDFYRVVKDDLGGGAAFARSYPKLADLDRAREASLFDRDLVFTADLKSRPRLVVSVSFDRVYARAFANGWIDSVAALTSQGVALHFHLMFRGKVDLDLLEQISDLALQKAVDLAISVETDVQQSNAYFASARFIKAASLQRHLDAPLLLADADSFIPDPESFASAYLPRLLSEARVMGLIVDGPWNGYLPWRRFSATWLFVPNRGDATCFLQRTADAIGYFWDPRGCNWWIDQMALEIGRRCVTTTMEQPPQFGDIFAEMPTILESSEEFKMSRITSLPEIRQMMESGMPYWQALEAFGRS